MQIIMLIVVMHALLLVFFVILLLLVRVALVAVFLLIIIVMAFAIKRIQQISISNPIIKLALMSVLTAATLVLFTANFVILYVPLVLKVRSIAQTAQMENIFSTTPAYLLAQVIISQM